MDGLIKEALKERAMEVTVPPGAWDRQRALLSNFVPKAARTPWWRPARGPARSRTTPPWGLIAEAALVGLLLIGLVVVTVHFGPPLSYRAQLGDPAAPPTRGPLNPATAPPTSGPLNPVVDPPTPRVIIAPDLPVLTPPPGSMTQEQIIAAGIAALGQSGPIHGGQMTLTQIGLVGDRWSLTFQGDGRAYTGMRGGPRPLDPRKGAYSHITPLAQLTYQIIGATGEVYSTGTTGALLAANRADLEHYRGIIVAGGEQTILRLVTEDDRRLGRDLTIWVPGQALGESGLDLWHMVYGTGRAIDVWGLTIAAGELLAYRVAMADPPSEALLDHDLIHGIPLPDGATWTNEVVPDGATYRVEGFTEESLKAWYLKQMERYGWQLGKPRNDNWQILRFVSLGWHDAELAITTDEQGLRFTWRWGSAPITQGEQVVAALFEQIGDDPTFGQFPRMPGAAQGEINIGGPYPGVTIPATFETHTWPMPDGSWEVWLYRSWGDGLGTTWRFGVDEQGGVRAFGQSGDQPPAIP